GRRELSARWAVRIRTITSEADSFRPEDSVMPTPLESLVACGTKLWLDSVDPDEVARNRAFGATGATSNPIIIADLIQTGRFDDQLARLIRDGLDDEAIAWQLTDQLVRQAQRVFEPV